MKKLTILIALLLGLVSVSAQAQTALTQTTLSAAMTSGQGGVGTQIITVASATNIVANGVLWIEGSVYRVTAVSGTSISVVNIYMPASHLNAAVVFIVPIQAQYGGNDPTGSCIRGVGGTFPLFSPFTLMFNTTNGDIAACQGNIGSRNWMILTFNRFNPTSNPPVTP